MAICGRFLDACCSSGRDSFVLCFALRQISVTPGCCPVSIDGGDAKVHIHELNLDNSAKYLLIRLSNEGDSYTLFNTNAVNLLKNAAAYLLNPNVYYDYASKLPVGIKNSAATARIGYLNGFINNPEQETVTIYNSVGMPLLTSSESHISVQHLHAGLYIAKTKTTTIKFMRR